MMTRTSSRSTTSRAKRGPCIRAVLKKDGSVKKPCPHDGRAPMIVLALFGATQRVRSLCAGCEADDVLEEGRREVARRESLWSAAVTAKQRDWSFETYVVNDARRRAAGAAGNWLERYRAGDRTNLFLHGEVGRGKTGLAVALARELVFVDGVACYVVNWRNLLQEIQAGFGERHTSTTEQRLENYFRVPVLAIDDVGAEQPTDWRRDQLATLVEARYGADLPMIVTTNYNQADLIRRLGHDDKVIGQRIVSRLMENAVSVRVEGTDQRAA